MKDPMARLRQEALEKEQARRKEKDHPRPEPAGRQDKADLEVAQFLEVSPEMVSACCGSICAHCDIFLDKAIALVELGYPHHLFMNSSQEEKFEQALELFRKDRAEYKIRRQELMDSMRR
ncbi:MAG: hypothetical protein OEV92_12930 [Nitrospinota bacterium]|nr:hypothetical protein [Nitrospinota bacterium]